MNNSNFENKFESKLFLDIEGKTNFIQGGLRTKGTIKKNVQNYLSIFKDYPYIFNLGHGVLPGTKTETIEYLIQIIRENEDLR